MSMKNRYKLWKDWSKHNLNNPIYKFLVLIGLAHSYTFETHRATQELFSQHPDYEYSVRDEKPEKSDKKTGIHWGWYAVYLLTIAVNSVMCSINGFNIASWQFWVWIWVPILSFVSGASYRK